jgi:hypothetical protein
MPDEATSTDVAVREQAALEAAENIKSQLDPNDVSLPLIKLAQDQSAVVKDKKVPAGEWFNSLTNESYGESFEFVIVNRYEGRFYSPKGGGTYVTTEDVAPSNWPDEYAGQAFTDIPDAEEQWKAAANAGGAWGSGPPIQTTYNYVGFVVSDLQAGTTVPVRLSFKSAATPTARQIDQLLNYSVSPWDRVFEIGVREDSNRDDQRFWNATVARGRPLSDEETAAAVELFTIIRNATVKFTGDEPERREKPAEAEGAIPVS